MSERVICSVCGREYQGIVPRGGDGSALRPRIHYAKPQTETKPVTFYSAKNNREYCSGSFMGAKLADFDRKGTE